MLSRRRKKERQALRESNRMFQCPRCRRVVSICRSCDRGNVYCSVECSASARRESIRRASRAYQRAPRGTALHLRRQRRYRERLKQVVTHQGSQNRSQALKTHRVALAIAMRYAGTSSGNYQSVLRVDECRSCRKPGNGWYSRYFLRSREPPD